MCKRLNYHNLIFFSIAFFLSLCRDPLPLSGLFPSRSISLRRDPSSLSVEISCPSPSSSSSKPLASDHLWSLHRFEEIVESGFLPFKSISVYGLRFVATLRFGIFINLKRVNGWLEMSMQCDFVFWNFMNCVYEFIKDSAYWDFSTEIIYKDLLDNL